MFFVGLREAASGFWNVITDRQDAANPLALLSDPQSAIQPADNFIGFQLAPAAVLPVAAVAYYGLFQQQIQDIISDIIGKYMYTTLMYHQNL